MQKGIITQIIGPVVDVAFLNSDMPPIYTALKVKNNENKDVVLEVEQHLGGSEVRTVAMTSTDGLVRGADVENTGKPISVPVGGASLGRLFNVLGETIDNKGELKSSEYWAIHRSAPEFKEQSVKTEIFETGLQGIYLQSS